MNNSAAKVGEIFTEAGAAFTKLAEMTMQLHPMAEQHTSVARNSAVKRKAATEDRYAMSTPTQQITVKTQGTVQHKIHESPTSQHNKHESPMSQHNIHESPISQHNIHESPVSQHNIHTSPLSRQVTLNMLNAQESEMDSEGLGNDVKLEFESSTEEVTA